MFPLQNLPLRILPYRFQVSIYNSCLTWPPSPPVHLTLPHSGKGNAIHLYDDNPLSWDAWDVDLFHLEKRRLVSPAHCTADQNSLQFRYQLSPKSVMEQTVTLEGDLLKFDCHVEWFEDHKFLKVLLS